MGEHQEKRVGKGKSGVWDTPRALRKGPTMGCPPYTGLAAPQAAPHLQPFLEDILAEEVREHPQH